MLRRRQQGQRLAPVDQSYPMVFFKTVQLCSRDPAEHTVQVGAPQPPDSANALLAPLRNRYRVEFPTTLSKLLGVDVLSRKLPRKADDPSTQARPLDFGDDQESVEKRLVSTEPLFGLKP
jgi:hypothetical protein